MSRLGVGEPLAYGSGLTHTDLPAEGFSSNVRNLTDTILADQLADFYQLVGHLTLTDDAPPPAARTKKRRRT